MSNQVYLNSQNDKFFQCPGLLCYQQIPNDNPSHYQIAPNTTATIDYSQETTFTAAQSYKSLITPGESPDINAAGMYSINAIVSLSPANATYSVDFDAKLTLNGGFGADGSILARQAILMPADGSFIDIYVATLSYVGYFNDGDSFSVTVKNRDLTGGHYLVVNQSTTQLFITKIA